jgi:hypothetical protein
MVMHPSSLASLYFRGYHSAARGNTELVLVLIGLVFAGLMVWAIERSGRATSR